MASNIHNALSVVLRRLADELGIFGLDHGNGDRFHLNEDRFHLDIIPVPMANEIQLGFYFEMMEIRNWIPTEIVQKWVGEPPQAYMFNSANIDLACERVAAFVRKCIVRYREGPEASEEQLVGLMSTTAGKYETWQTKLDASAAWDEKNYDNARRLYEKIADDLTEVEKKRLAIARKKSV